MVQCYVVLWIVYKFLHDKGIRRWAIVFLSFIFASVVCEYAKEFLPIIIDKLLGQTFLPYFYIFLLGGMMMEYFDKVIHFFKKHWFLFFLLAQMQKHFSADIASYGLIHTALLLCSMIGFAYRLRNFNLPVDLSYGFYVYHMVVINMMIELGYLGKIIYVIVALGLSLILASISYFTIGTWERRKKKNLDMTDFSPFIKI